MNVKIKKDSGLFSLLILIGLLIFFVFTVWLFHAYRQRIAYREDVAYVYSVASRLIYTQNDFVSLNHSVGSFPDDDTDIINLSFTTNETADDFSGMINHLGFRLQSTYGPWTDNTFLDSINRGTSRKLWLSPSSQRQLNTVNTSWERNPVTTTWSLIDNQRGLDITYADTNERKDVWKYDNRTLTGNIVVISLKRHLTGHFK